MTCTALVLLMSPNPVLGQESPPTFPAKTEVVVVDMVARDKDGAIVTDLRADEVEVYEEGVRCPIEGFRLVGVGEGVRRSVETEGPQGGPGEARAPVAPERPADGASAGRPLATPPPTRPSIVVLVFDQLGLDSATRARAAALDLVAERFPPTTWFAVYKVGSGARLLQAFTQDKSLLPTAIGKATPGSERSTAPSGSPDYDSLVEEYLALASGAEGTPTADADADAREGATSLVERKMNAMRVKELSLQAELDREIRGRGTLHPLLDLVRGLEGVQGRKTLIYFSEGLQVPDAVEPLFRDLQLQARQSNVVVNTVDARGLLVDGPWELTKKAATLAPSVSQALRYNVLGNLEELAEETGGLLIAQTNDLRPGVRRIGEGLQTYYEIAYLPPTPPADGEFREIEVKVARRGAKVATRRGYTPFPAGATEVFPYELPLAQALEETSLVRDFEHRAATLCFADAGEETETTVLVEVPLSGLRFDIDEGAHAYRAHYSVLALIRDADGKLAVRLSHDSPLEGPSEEVEAVQHGTSTVKRTVRLKPGRYTLETAVSDRLAQTISTRKTLVMVPATSDGLALGSLVVGQAAPVPNERPAVGPAADPLEVGDVRAVPLLGRSLPEGTPTVSVLLSLHPAAVPEAVSATLEIKKDGVIVGRAVPELPEADARGRMAYLGTLPIGDYAPGRYEVWARVRQGEAEAAQATSFTIAPRTSVPPEAAWQAAAKMAANPGQAAKPLQPRPEGDLGQILDRAGAYVARYAETLSNVVAEESYRQWYLDGSSRVVEVRTLRSDMVFVALPGDALWSCFRDIYESDGKRIRDRDGRLERLFSEAPSDAVEEANALLWEGSRYNLVLKHRTVNVPTLSLRFLHPIYQRRFSFERKGKRTIEGVQGVEVRFEEIARPTVVRDSQGRDIPASGRFWIDPDHGTVLRADVEYDMEPEKIYRHQTGSITTQFRREPGLDIFVPEEMKETYEINVGNITVEGAARYSNYRRFNVTTDEHLAGIGREPGNATGERDPLVTGGK